MSDTDPFFRRTGSYDHGLFIGPLWAYELAEAEGIWRMMRRSDYHEGKPYIPWEENEDVQEELWDLAEYFALPLTNNGVGRTYHYVMAGDLIHEIIKAFTMHGWVKSGVTHLPQQTGIHDRATASDGDIVGLSPTHPQEKEEG